jgi:cytochrome d ubiquinol oxidase subunit II
MIDVLFSAPVLPVVFAALMGVAILVYVILDGYDLGVGILMARATAPGRDVMIASIGPFWDANETWLVLGVGLLLVAFPVAHGIILTALYIPVALMLVGLILRGVAFEFRAKGDAAGRVLWDRVFTAGSLATALCQGWMLGAYIMGFADTALALAFSALTAVCLAAGYALVGAGWLVMKTDGELQRRAVAWSRGALVFTALGLAAVSVASPLASPRVFARWFDWPEIVWLAPLPLVTLIVLAVLWRTLAGLPAPGDRRCWVPFAGAALLFVLGFAGLAYSFFPFVVPDRLTVWEAASAPEALAIILVGALVVVPFILAYTALAYRIFWGKARDLHYH